MNKEQIDPTENLTPDQRQMYELMSEISEDCYCAGWMRDNEFTLWSSIQTGEMRYGMSDIDRELLARVAALSVKTGCWIVWRDEHDGPEYAHVDTWGPYAITLAEWGAIYDAKNDMRAENSLSAQDEVLTDAAIIDKIDRPGFAWENLGSAEQRNLLSSIRELIFIAVNSNANEPMKWTYGPDVWKDWCANYFGPDADESYLAKAVFDLPPVAQKFANPAAAAPSPAVVVEPVTNSHRPIAWCTDAHFEAWCERHDMRKDRGDHREMFDDAASLYLTVPATSSPSLAVRDIPREPTSEMMEAANRQREVGGDMKDCWRAMWDAAMREKP